MVKLQLQLVLVLYFSLKCEVTDSDNNTATDIHSVIVGGFLLSKKQRDNKANINIPPTEVTLSGNYPNPFNPSTVISMHYAVGSNSVVNIYNTQGVLVENLINGFVEAGTYEVTWDAAGMPSGVYLVTMQAGTVMQSQKIVLMK